VLLGERVGVVTSSWHAGAGVGATGYFLAALAAAYGAIRGARAIARRGLPRRGRWLHPWGFVDARGPRWRVRSIADFQGCDVEVGSSGAMGLVLIKIKVRFGEATEEFALATSVQYVEKHVPREALAALAQRRDALRALAAAGDRAALEREDPLAFAAPSSATDPERAWIRRARLAALAAAAATVVALYCGILPLLSLDAAERNQSAQSLRAAAAAYPFSWVKSRAAAAVHARYQLARRAAADRAPAQRALLERLLDYGEQHDATEVRFSLVPPPKEETDRATAWLKTQTAAQPGTRAAEVFLFHASLSIIDTVVGEDELRRGLDSGLRKIVPYDVLHFEDRLPPETKAPTIVVTSSITPTGVLSGEGRARYAALAFSYRVFVELPGAAREPLPVAVTIPASDRVEVGRLTFGNEKLRPLGDSEGGAVNMLEDSMVYTNEVSAAATKAADALSPQLF
jgi:hypothetical protein